MDTSKHTVTIPMEDYERMKQIETHCSLQESILSAIEDVLRVPKMDRIERFDKIRNIMNNWIPQHDLDDEE